LGQSSGFFLCAASRNRCLALWNEFKVNNTLNIEESYERFDFDMQALFELFMPLKKYLTFS
jgi:hypothetical protein